VGLIETETPRCRCWWDSFAEEFAKYLHYCRNLRFDEVPDYRFLRGLFIGLFKKSGFTDDWMFDWMVRLSAG
jgi:hypothetical protein